MRNEVIAFMNNDKRAEKENKLNENDSEKEKGRETENENKNDKGTVDEIEVLEGEELLSQEEQKKIIEEKEEYYDKLMRLQAEFENYKKRMANERQKDKKYGAEVLMKGLLPVLDNFERALSNIKEKASQDDEIYQGVEMIYDQLVDVLEQNGLTKIESAGEKFDPNYHECVMMLESEEHSKNTVVEEMQRGYLLHDKLLRACMVKVSK